MKKLLQGRRGCGAEVGAGSMRTNTWGTQGLFAGGFGLGNGWGGGAGTGGEIRRYLPFEPRLNHQLNVNSERFFVGGGGKVER